MDFLAGAITGLAVSSLFFVLSTVGVANALSSRMSSLESAVSTKTKKETWDDADYWKHGYENEDEI